MQLCVLLPARRHNLTIAPKPPELNREPSTFLGLARGVASPTVMRMNRPLPRSRLQLTLGDYYLLEGLNSGAATLFLLSIFFWTRARFGFSDAANLWLGVVQGGIYIAFSWYGGRMADRIGYHRAIGWSIAAAVCILSALLVAPWPMAPYLVMALYTAAMAMIWPSLEAAIVHTPGRWTTPQRVAIYNVTWAAAGVMGFFASGQLFTWWHGAIIVVPVGLHVAQLGWLALRWLRPVAPRTAAAAAAAAPRAPAHGHTAKPGFLHVAWLGNTLGYFVITSFGALSPHIGERLGLTPRLTIWLVCAMLFTRTLSFVVFGRWEAWHYRWRWLLGSVMLLPLTLAASFFSPHVWIVLLSQVAMGIVLGLIYSSSLYYSLDVGENKGEHSGLHEAMIGVGILAGPLAGVIGARCSGSVDGAKIVILAAYVVAAAVGLLAIRHHRSRTPRSVLPA